MRLIVSVVLTCLVSVPSIAGDSWSQWRGPARDGAVPADTAPWPDDFSTLEQAWRVPLGKGYPGPIVAGNRVFTVESVDRKTVAARAFDVTTGEELWKRTWPGTGSVPFFAKANGDWVRSTPATDGKLLFVGDMSEVLMALDVATGEVAWQIDFPAKYDTNVPDFGFASSPLVDGDFLFVQAANSLVKLNKATGEEVWRRLNHSGAIQASGAFSSPTMETIAGRKQLLVQTRHELYGVDPDSGDVLWSHEVPNFRGMNILTPVVHGDSIFTSPYKQQSFMYAVKRGDDAFEISEAWTNKATAYMSSPVVIDGHAYMHLGNGRLECMDLETGTSRWRTEPLGSKYWSMATQGDKIMALDSSGALHLVKADPASFKKLDTKAVSDEDTWGYVAVAGDTIFVRELEGISAWRWTE
jgi:outer membrane protein assembly factor BamB